FSEGELDDAGPRAVLTTDETALDRRPAQAWIGVVHAASEATQGRRRPGVPGEQGRRAAQTEIPGLEPGLQASAGVDSMGREDQQPRAQGRGLERVEIPSQPGD